MSRVWETNLKLSSAQKFVLLCLADFAADDGTSCYPSYGLVAWKCALSKRSVMRVVQELQQMDILHMHHSKRKDGSQSTNKYFLNTKVLLNESCAYSDRVSPDGCQEITPVVTQCHSIDPPYDPPVINKKIIIKKVKTTDPQLEEEMTKEKDKAKQLVNDAKEVIQLINKLTGKEYKETTKIYLEVITQRMKEGNTLQQCKTVVARKAQEWIGDKVMEKYVRIKTIFAKSNFYEYVAECVTDEELKQRRNNNA